MNRNEPRPEGPLTASIERLRQELDRWMDTAMSQGERALDAMGLRGQVRTWSPAIDLIETPDAVQAVIELPGVDPRSIDVALVGSLLTVKGEKAGVQPIEGETAHLQERTRGPFSRSIPMPAAVNPDAVTAEARDGVLWIRIGKADMAKSRQIPVRVETRTAAAEAPSPSIEIPPGAQP